LDVLSKLGSGVIQQIEVLHADVVELSIVLVALAIFLVALGLFRRWKKKKGYRMVLRDRNDKIHLLITDIINDGLFEAECRGEISNKEVRDLYKELSQKLDLPDLVPKKHRLAIVKEELKRLRYSKDPNIVKLRDLHPNIPGGPPTPIKSAKFGATIGKIATRFRVVK
jgi:hypothetical protein